MKLNFLKKECINCNIREKRSKNIRCSDCFFMLQNEGSISGKIFKEYGLYLLPKKYVYYFLYNPDLNWTLPSLPEVDFIGNKRQDRIRWEWVIHHEDGNPWNDSKENLILCLNTEHRYFHNLENNPMKNQDVNQKVKKKHMEKVKAGVHHLQTNNPMKDPIIIQKMKGGMRERILLGTHNFVGDNNPNVNTRKQNKILNWLLSISDGKYEINKDLVEFFEYSTYASLRFGIKKIIEREKLIGYYFVDNGKLDRYKKWYLTKGV